MESYQVSPSKYRPIPSTPVDAVWVPRIDHKVVAQGESPNVLVTEILSLQPCYSDFLRERL